MTGLLLLALALVLAVASALAWTGRWRAWSRSAFWGTMPLHLYPALAIFAGFAGFDELLEGEVPAAFGMLLLVALVLGFLGFLGLVWRVPSWTTPRWYREADRTLDITSDPLAALTYLGVARGTPIESEALGTAPFDGQPETFRWGANWVHDPSATRVDHVLAGVGAVSGRLVGFPEGVAFVALASEERLREQGPIAISLGRGDIRRVGTVPPGADASGDRQQVPLATRLQRPQVRRRLVLHTADAAHVFEVRKARRRADEIAQQYGIERGPDA